MLLGFWLRLKGSALHWSIPGRTMRYHGLPKSGFLCSSLFLHASVITTLCPSSATARSFLVGFSGTGMTLFQPRNKDQPSFGSVQVSFICVCSRMSNPGWNTFPLTAPQLAPPEKYFLSVFRNFLFAGVRFNSLSQQKCWPKAISWGFIPKNHNVSVRCQLRSVLVTG